MEQDDKGQYLKQGTLAVLRDRVRNQTPIRVSHQRGQFITRLLYTDISGMVINLSSHDDDNQLAKEAYRLHIITETSGALIELFTDSLAMKYMRGCQLSQACYPTRFG
ncbi:flagellar brake protein [Erwinia amylovora]|uniref:flagellar brake protein n=1 Tax=Erwinia amylovora TaxID=552 RepID=UPI0002CBF1E6|nr:flagellar brake protein [Erwinia amylovora]CCP06994.1 YcgR [Erwinia amylovora MR1]